MKLFVVPVILISMVVGTLALDCYSCAGDTCKDPFDPSGSGISNACTDVPGFPTTHCVKAVSGSSVIRSCATICPAEGCVGSVCNYCCSSNLCNGGNTVTTSFVAISVAMLAAFILARQ